MSLRTSLRRSSVALLAVVALTAGACGGSGDPQADLSAAIEATFDDAFAFAFTVDADQSALAALGEGASQAAFFLSGFKVTGATEGDNTTITLGLLNIDVLQARAIGRDAVYLRLGLEDIAALTGTPIDAEALAGQLDEFGLDPEVRATVVTALGGGWVGIEGALDTEQLQELLGGTTTGPSDDDVEAAVRDNFGPDPPAFIGRFVTVSERTDQDGQETFRVDLQVRSLLRAAADLSTQVNGDVVPLEDLEADLAELPETVPGTIVVEDGRVAEIRFDLGDAVRGEVEGRIDLTLKLSDHGEVAAIEPPEGAKVLSAEQFSAAVGQVMGFLTGFGG